MTTVNIYLTFNGNCEEAFLFYKNVFGGEFAYISKFKDIPASEEYVPEEADLNRIMHVSLPISNETVLMGSDISSKMAATFVQGSNFSVSIGTDNNEETKRLFDALAENGTIIMPLTATFWSPCFGMCIDKFGISWMVSVETEK